MDLKDESVRDDVTSGSRLFYVLAAATGNARLPMVRRRVRGTTSDEVDDDRRRRRPEVQRLAADCQSCRLARVHGDTGTPTWHACTRFAEVKQPCDVFTSTWLEHQMSRCVHDSP